MKNIVLLGIFLCVWNVPFAQVSINDDNSAPDNSAMLDVQSTNKGILPPRVALTALNVADPITSPATGLFVYNTAANGTSPNNVIPGYYCWNGVRWVAVIVPLGSSPGDMLYWDGTQWVNIPAGLNGQVLKFANGIPAWSQAPFSCGAAITINHLSSGVVPVFKLVTYGTVTNIPGEALKCWITSNLGASHPAVAVNDDSEASAGWYWQFNRKQGYKNDGTTLTPAWTITWIDENSDWISANDPCTIELGPSWRIPVYTEWYNVDNTGAWTSWNDPWNSNLKLHAAGYLNYTDGSLNFRGSSGSYWSSTQKSTNLGWYLYFHSSNSHLNYYTRANGYTLRCLRE